jgi:hypothetical protein
MALLSKYRNNGNSRSLRLPNLSHNLPRHDRVRLSYLDTVIVPYSYSHYLPGGSKIIILKFPQKLSYRSHFIYIFFFRTYLLLHFCDTNFTFNESYTKCNFTSEPKLFKICLCHSPMQTLIICSVVP